MKITGIQSLYQTHASSLQSGKNINNEGQAGNNSCQSPRCDSVQLSSQASLQVGLESKCKDYSSGWKEASSEKIEALKLKYQGDQCPVSGKDVAKAMMERATGNIAE